MSTPAAVSLSITRTEQDQRPMFTLAGELDASTAPRLATTVIEVVNQGVRDIILDTGGVTRCDASGLAVLTQIAGRLRSQAGRLALVAPSAAVRQALDAGEVGSMFVVAPSVAAALYAIHRDHP